MARVHYPRATPRGQAPLDLAALAGDHFRTLRAQWAQEVPTLAFIDIAEQGREIEVCDLGGQRVSRIGRDVVASALGSALLFELSQG